MIQIDLPPLVKRLNLFSRQALEMAASECMSQQAAEITVSHVLIQMLAMPRSDLRVITRQGDIGMEELRQALTVENYTTARSADSYPAFSPMLVEWLKEGWLLASAEMQHSELRGGVLLLALLHSPLRYIPPAAARLLTGINRDRLQQDFVQWTQESAESVVPDADGKGAGTMTDASDTLLARYAKNMTADARNGRLDPVLCRDHEIDLMIDILCRRRKNNPVVVGEAGVGKSALIEGLALRIVAGQVPDKLKNTDIMTLDLGALQAGASVKGEFEKRFKGLMAEVISSPVPVILFIDEAHTLIGAGNQQGGLDISNLLKPALARGELKTIAATTWSEYKKYFEKDAALSRRFQLVKVSEPNAAEATIILRGLSAVYEQSHGVLIDDDALQAAATLSERYLSGRQLPDKAIDVLDNPRSAQDASLDAFERFFKPDGILDTFYQQNLKLFIDNDLSLEDGDNNVIIREDIIAQLETAQKIRDIFFSKQNGLGTSFAVETVSLSGNKRRSVLNLDGQLVDYSQGRNYTAHLVWPNNMREGNESKLTLIGTSGNAPRSISFSGPWAQFRLFGAGQLTGVQDGNFTVRFSVDGGAMTYRVHTDTEDNPFSGGLFSQFGLSDTLY
ncbi:AAA family ATPase [Escherichia coli]|uniref:type VI secretion IcmF C-terminal domain-containing protein n=1 Tax=Escherichia coli TaxID=562 RepID=UPI0020774EDE|nr:type VI secretion IcmF C-terminal domain-containing protein [Escherichia coli]MCS0698128.1 AAA family ATPase [Escherichia coli]MCS0895637.1 AAA family ATPase [Escherichia coli]MDE7969868.1 type VI secretion IcmF C-terminal domain-containing protein [Escherichia coli]MED8665047.1 type VI secretion IcmF C-terminal domain-containing protein [Escherichia coli]